MPRYVAFLRGVNSLNAKMPELKRTFEEVGFTNVKTVLGSGNVAFNAPAESEESLARQAESAMVTHLGRAFYTIVRSSPFLRELLEADPFTGFNLPANAKRIVTFLGSPPGTEISLPIVRGDVQILAMYGRDILTAYIVHQREPTVLPLIEKTFGNKVTTRTWETVKKCAKA